jgi:hypothetical protein
VFALQPINPIMVRVAEQPVESTSVRDILIGSLGLTMLMLLSAVLLGVVLGGVLIGFKKLRTRLNQDRPSEGDTLRVTPGGAS